MRATILAFILTTVGLSSSAQSLDKAAFQRNLQWAQMGQPKAQLAVGQDYMRGRVVRRSYPSAHDWLQKASDAGMVDAKALLGRMKINGLGEPPDTAGGLALLNEASEAHSGMAKALLGSLYESGMRIQKNAALALKLYQDGTDGGDTYCMALLGNMYLVGNGGAQDLTASKTLLERSALLGDEWGAAFLGDALLHGSYGAPDPARAMALFQTSARAGNPEALYKLGTIYEEGKLVPQDLNLAGHYYARAADIDFAPAENALAAMYDLGIGFVADKSLAYFWAALAAAQGNTSAKARVNLLQTELSAAELDKVQQHIHTFHSIGVTRLN